MKVLIVISSVNSSGGTERVGCMLANSLSEVGYEVILASISYGDKPFFPINKEIKLVSLMNFSDHRLLRIPNTIYKLRRLLKEEELDALIVVETLCSQFTIPATIGLPVKHICWEHLNFNHDLGVRSRRVARQLAARYCDSVVTLTERDRQYWLDGTHHKSQILAIENACPFPPQDYIKRENTKTVLAVGRLIQVKGFDMLLEAWVQVSDFMPDWKLVIVGEGKERNKLTKFIEENELTEKVNLVGKTSDVSKYYKEAEIFCLSSRFEGFPMVLLEALAFGLPIVSFDCDTGPAEILEGTGSILVPKNNIDELASALIELMDNKEDRKIMGLQGKEKSKKYQPKEIIGQWIELLETSD